MGQEEAGGGERRQGGEQGAEDGGEEEEEGLAEGEGDSLHGGDAEGVLLEAEDCQGMGHVGLVVLGGEGGGRAGGVEGGVHTWERSERDWGEGDRQELGGPDWTVISSLWTMQNKRGLSTVSTEA